MANALSFLGCDTAVDLGTANTRVHMRGHGLVCHEPSVVAVDSDTGKVLECGTAAKLMIGRTPRRIRVVRPVRRGVIVDFYLAQRMLRCFLRKARPWRSLARPRLAAAVPSGVTPVERHALEDAVFEAGARRVFLIEVPLAAAIGAGLVVHEPAAAMVLDVGGGCTDAAIMSLGGVVTSHAVRTGGARLDQAIAGYLRREMSLLVGEGAAEILKIAVARAGHGAVRGRDAATGLPRTVTVSAGEVRAAIADPLRAIVGVATTVLESCPPELSGDLMDHGIALTGGGAMLDGLDELIHAEVGIPVHVADDPCTAVVHGTAHFLQGTEALRVGRTRPRGTAAALG